MKKRITALFFALALIVSMASAAAPRWSYMSGVVHGIIMEDDALVWSANAVAYPVEEVTSVKTTADLQVQAGGGWGTVDSDSNTKPGITASAYGTFYDWLPNKSYRLRSYSYIYSGDTLIESVGPLYFYYNT